MRVLDVGCGDTKVGKVLWPDAEYVGVDANPAVQPDVVADVREMPPELGQFDVVFSNHVLEHLRRLDVVPALKHWGSFLKPDGKMWIAVPDLLWAAKRIVHTDGAVQLPEMLHMYGMGSNEWQQHQMGFTVLTLRASVGLAGLQVRSAEIGPYTLHVPDKDGEMQDLKPDQILVSAVKPPEESRE